MKIVHGFTLIELLVTIVVASILLAIALPSYRSFVIKGARADARGQLLNIAQMEERFISNQVPPTYLAYANSGTAQGFPYFSGNDYGSRKYDITVATATSGTYAITATPANGFSDPTCGSLVLDNIGNRSSTTADPSCWR